MCAHRCPTVKYLYPQTSQMHTLLTELTLPLLNQSKASVTAGGASLTDSLNSSHVFVLESSLLNRHCTLQLESIITTAPVPQKCQHRLKGPSVCLSVRLSVCSVCLFFMGAGGKAGEWATKCSESEMSRGESCCIGEAQCDSPSYLSHFCLRFVFGIKKLLFLLLRVLKRSHFVGLIV